MADRRQRFPRLRDGASTVSPEAIARVQDGSPHRPLLLREVLRCLQPRPGDVVVDATLGGGGHARALLEHIAPHGRLVGLDVDASSLARTAAHLRAAGFGPDAFTAHHASFADLPAVLAREGLAVADLVLADLGVSTLQVENPERGFGQAVAGPLDLRFDPTRPEPASALLASIDAATLRALLTSVDEPYAEAIARVLAGARVATTHALQRVVRSGLSVAHPDLPARAVIQSVRRTLLALRMAVNDEMGALERFLGALPRCLTPGGRVAILTFHSGEDRRVKQAFRTGHRVGAYASIAREVIRSTTAETRLDRRAMGAKLRWAVGPDR